MENYFMRSRYIQTMADLESCLRVLRENGVKLEECNVFVDLERFESDFTDFTLSMFEADGDDPAFFTIEYMSEEDHAFQQAHCDLLEAVRRHPAASDMIDYFYHKNQYKVAVDDEAVDRRAGTEFRSRVTTE